MPYAGTSKVNQEDEESIKEIDSKRKQVEQYGKRKDTQEIYDWVDQLLPICGYEKPDGNYGRMASPQNPCGVLETMEESANEI